MNEEPMPAFGTVALLRLDVSAKLYRKFLRLIIREAPAEPLEGTDITRFVIKADHSERWMVVIFDAIGATYKLEGQLLSPDILSPEDDELCFLGRIAYNSTIYGEKPLDWENSSEAFDLVEPLIQSLSRRVRSMLPLSEPAG